MDERVLAYLTEKSLRATHALEPGANDLALELRWAWNLSGDNLASRVEFAVTLSLTPGDPHVRVGVDAIFTVWIDGAPRTATMTLPETDLADGLDEELARLIVAALGPLAAQAMSANEGET